MALDASIIIRAIDRATAPMRRVTKNFRAMKDAAKVADKQFKRAADMRQAAEGVSRFASAARSAIGGPVEAAQNFNYEMSRVRALSKANAKDFTTLRDKALELGASIGEFSALDAAKGMSEFAIAGYDTSQVIKALPTSLDLATAAQTSLADTIKITTGVMGAFGKDASQAADVGNILAATMTGSKTTLQTLGETFSYVGSTADLAGVKLEDAAVIAGMLGEASIDASRAGTALTTILLRLAAPRRRGKHALKDLRVDIEEVVNGAKQMRGPVSILADISDAMKDMSNTQQVAYASAIFGQNAVGSALTLMSKIGGDKMRKLDHEVRNATGGLDKMAATMRDNGKTASMELSSSLQTLAINTGDTLEPVITSVSRKLSGMVLGLNKAVKEHPTLTKVTMGTIGVTALLASGLAAMMFAATAASTTLGVLAIAMGSSKTGTQLLGAALKPMVGIVKKAIVPLAAYTAAWWKAAAGVLAASWPILAVVAAIAAVSAAVYFAIKHWDTLTGIWERFKAASLPMKIAVIALLAPVLALLSPILAIAYAVKKIMSNWEPVKAFFVDLWSSVTNAVETALEWLNKVKLPGPLRTILEAHLGAGRLLGGAASAAAGAVAGVAKEAAYVATGNVSYAPPEGKLAISIDAEGRPNVRQAESTGLQMDVDTGYAMVTP